MNGFQTKCEKVRGSRATEVARRRTRTVALQLYSYCSRRRRRGALRQQRTCRRDHAAAGPRCRRAAVPRPCCRLPPRPPPPRPPPLASESGSGHVYCTSTVLNMYSTLYSSAGTVLLLHVYCKKSERSEKASEASPKRASAARRRAKREGERRSPKSDQPWP